MITAAHLVGSKCGRCMAVRGVDSVEFGRSVERSVLDVQDGVYEMYFRELAP